MDTPTLWDSITLVLNILDEVGEGSEHSTVSLQSVDILPEALESSHIQVSLGDKYLALKHHIDALELKGKAEGGKALDDKDDLRVPARKNEIVKVQE